MRIRASLVGFIAVFQAILFATHFLLFETWTHYSGGGEFHPSLWFQLAIAILSVSFLVASLLAFRYTNLAVRVVYRIAAVWLGMVSFLAFAAALSWIVFGMTSLAGLPVEFHRIAELLFGLATLASLLGLINAGWTRVRRVAVRLENLPESWRGRTAALVSDLHLGHFRNGRFLKSIVSKIMAAKPDVIFVAGDLYDGTAINAYTAAEPLRNLRAELGTYFVAGNHEQFRDDSEYLQAVAAANVRVLRNEKVLVDGLQIVGVPYNHATHDGHFSSVLQQMNVDRGNASILLTHAPDRPHIAEKAGISLQLSGHTHLGQFYPWTWMAKRMYRQFVFGLSRIGKLQVYTSSGAGTWGPPMRLGSNPEIVLLEFI
ncbi:MAG TPA: metallophosphoesterase [Candidatus Saccharimonadales bacterium]|nr:metallophosphoesterase [Candidatus Saccharimonadales bacterium]